ncbi:hypothetical protein [Bifidobacterium sp. SO1]|uniref:hypothetical protein n=1 Tax=Bifidobacterium sp. SO1 TaxID=2809029 RepID=UPI001BDC6B12|nr:hypothetical protein [Bifidobacterium sp. SO1]MBT1162663.1 hypothetical protein [Bifidobacterium sp. SO1]
MAENQGRIAYLSIKKLLAANTANGQQYEMQAKSWKNPCATPQPNHTMKPSY